jgi:hypothetical protein
VVCSYSRTENIPESLGNKKKNKGEGEELELGGPLTSWTGLLLLAADCCVLAAV